MSEGQNKALELVSQFLAEHPSARHGPAFEVINDRNFSDQAIRYAMATVDQCLSNRGHWAGRRFDVQEIAATKKLLNQLATIPEQDRVNTQDESG